MHGVPAGSAVDVGPGPGGNAGVLRDLGWRVTGVELNETAAGLCAARGLDVVRGEATRLPIRSGSADLVMSTDVWEHVEDDQTVAREAFRALRPGGRLLVAVPADRSMWSGHDVALGHVRRYERADLVELVRGVGFVIHDLRSWNVLLRPVAMMRRGRNRSESEMGSVLWPLNAALRATVAVESLLPVSRLPGLSLVLRAFRP